MISSNLANRSGPVRRALLSETPLNFEAALATRRTLPGLLGFSTGCLGRYQVRGGGGCCILTFFEILLQGFVKFGFVLRVFSEAFFEAAELT